MSKGFEIYTRKEKFDWKIACMDIGVTFFGISAIFVAFFSVFSMPYELSWVYFLQGIAIPLAIFAVWGKKYRILRLAIIVLFGVLSYVFLKINVLAGVRPCANSAIRLINDCYNYNLSEISGFGATVQGYKISFLWVLCVLEFLFGVVFLDVLKRGRGRVCAIFVFLFPVILGIFCGKVPEISEGCFLILAIFFFLIVSHQREYVPVKALVCAVVLLFCIWQGARPIESSIYGYKRTHLKEYREIKIQLIDARSLELSNWIPETLKKINFGKSDGDAIGGIGWNEENLKNLESVNSTGKVVDEVVVSSKPTSRVYWRMFEGYVYDGKSWKEKGAKGVYDELKELKKYCAEMQGDSSEEIFEALDSYLKNGFRYTKRPGKMPADMDFAEGFLFERKEGFCVHFATAATIVYQMCGREARYAEGYMILPSDFKEQADGSYKAIVTDYMAHAWCETYEGENEWKVREHTLSSGLRTESPIPTDPEQVTVTPTSTPVPSVTETPTQGLPEDDGTPTPPDEDSDERLEGNPDKPFDQNGQGGNSSAGNGAKKYEMLLIIWDVIKRAALYLLGMGMAVAVVIVVLLAQRKIRRKRKKQKFQNRYAKKAILEIYRAVQELCIFEGMKDREVWRREHLDKISEQFPQISIEEWVWIYDCAERTMFSNDVMQVEEKKQMYVLYQKLRKGILRTLRGRKRLWFLYGRAL